MNDEITVFEPAGDTIREALATGISQLSPTGLTIITCTLIVSFSAVIAYASSCGNTISLGHGLFVINKNGQEASSQPDMVFES